MKKIRSAKPLPAILIGFQGKITSVRIRVSGVWQGHGQAIGSRAEEGCEAGAMIVSPAIISS
ncbi:MAG TPA: hypothetical protein VF243_05390 [Nitrosospira sp.]